jgi:hypothetical protein
LIVRTKTHQEKRMNRYVLKDRKHIDAAIVDLDNNALAQQARDEFAEKYGALGHKTVMSAQDRDAGFDVMAVTMLKFRRASPEGFVTVGQDKDGSVLGLPDFRTQKGSLIAEELADLPAFSRQLPQALGMSAKIADGKISFGVAGIEELGRQIVVKTTKELPAHLDVQPMAEQEYLELQQGAVRVQQWVKSQAPSPLSR